MATEVEQAQLRDQLRTEILANVEFEPVLTAFRRGFLEGRGNENIPFMVSLACQCFNNEYIYPVSEEEQRAVLRLKEHLASVRDLIVYAMYEPLHTVRDAAFRLGLDRDPDAQEIFTRQICEPAEEWEIKKSILSFGVSDDPISQAVREQYEESPYPRWVDFALPEPLVFRDAMRGRFPDLKSDELASPVRLLIAGCGTGSHPIAIAAEYSDAKVTAIDFSKTSLAYAIRKARGYALPNLNFLHGDILSLEAHQEFDAIEAIGVLHHMSDPVAGLRALVRTLKPGGFIKLGLYSRRARSVLSDAKRLISERNIGTSPNELRAIRQEIIRRQSGATRGPLDRLDFYYTSGFRDLLCHAREISFYPAELKSILDSAGLTVIGYRGIDSATKAKYLEKFPRDPYMRDLDLVDEFEAEHPDLFRGKLQILWARTK
jgi:SAM-dependent methyltransferase